MSDLFAHARGTDPATSHEAAAAISTDLRQIQARVSDYVRSKGPEGVTDAEMEEELDDQGSTFRTRRAELTARNIVLDSGQKRTFGDSPRRRVVWVHRDHVPDAPPVVEPVAPLTPADRAEATQVGKALDGTADFLRKNGWVGAADNVKTGAELLKRLGR